ncbi:hypothetical protein OH77DRAFT_524625 [Trametes cingulata]|nr:hypothetical protein OH77DRAFT_524625 [Trametes cingulata]
MSRSSCGLARHRFRFSSSLCSLRVTRARGAGQRMGCFGRRSQATCTAKNTTAAGSSLSDVRCHRERDYIYHTHPRCPRRHIGRPLPAEADGTVYGLLALKTRPTLERGKQSRGGRAVSLAKSTLFCIAVEPISGRSVSFSNPLSTALDIASTRIGQMCTHSFAL